MVENALLLFYGTGISFLALMLTFVFEVIAGNMPLTGPIGPLALAFVANSLTRFHIDIAMRAFPYFKINSVWKFLVFECGIVAVFISHLAGLYISYRQKKGK
jgi:hypothetical protein